MFSVFENILMMGFFSWDVWNITFLIAFVAIGIGIFTSCSSGQKLDVGNIFGLGICMFLLSLVTACGLKVFQYGMWGLRNFQNPENGKIFIFVGCTLIVFALIPLVIFACIGPFTPTGDSYDPMSGKGKIYDSKGEIKGYYDRD